MNTKHIITALVLALVLTTVSQANAGGYVYGPQIPAKAVTVSMLGGTAGAGSHASIWLGAESPDHKSWVQAGILLDQDHHCVFVETNTGPAFTPSLRCLRPAAFGDSATVKMTFSNRHGAVIWVDGQAVANVHFPIWRMAKDGLGHTQPFTYTDYETYGDATIQPAIKILRQ